MSDRALSVNLDRDAYQCTQPEQRAKAMVSPQIRQSGENNEGDKGKVEAHQLWTDVSVFWLARVYDRATCLKIAETD